MGRTARALAPGAVLALLSLAYLAEPEGRGGLAFFGTALVGLVSLIVGPLVHRPVNRGPWRWLAAAGALFLVGLLLRLGVADVPAPVGIPDLWAFAGYGCLALFLSGLLRRTHGGSDRSLWLDTAAMTAASALIGWVMNVAPELTGDDPRLGTAVVNAVYPVMDTALLALTVQLAFRRAGVLALRAALIGLTAMLVGDFGYTFVWAADPDALNPYVNVCYLFAYGSLGVMAMHPSMRELSDVDAPYVPQLRRARLAMVLMALLVPASIPVLMPTHGWLDGVVRTLIMSLFGLLVFLRLVGTISALRRAEAQARYRAGHDALTDLPNRPALLARLAADDRAGRPPWLNVMFVDCDDFTRINDSWGYGVGDAVLVQIAGRLRSLMGDDDRLARVGGDHFVVCMDAEDEDATADLARRVEAVFAEPVAITGDRTTLLAPRIGIARAHRDVAAGIDLVARAELALNHAKSVAGTSSQIYEPSMHERVVRRHRLADALRGALERGEIHVAYQPIRSGPGYAELTGWEALARWDHPEFGSVSPGEFVPIAEDTGVIVEIGAFVLREAATNLHRWQSRFGRADLHVSVNVSSVQLRGDDVTALVTNVLRRSGLAPEALWLEITESVVLERTDEILAELNRLAGLGIQLCMDDFGTGYSSMSYLKDFPVHVLKIDRSFVMNMVQDRRDRELTKAMLGVSRALGLAGVVAEGVETVEQAAVLEQLGCPMAQGYLYGRPVPATDAERAAAELLGAVPSAPSAMPGEWDGSVPGVPRPRASPAGTPTSPGTAP